MAVKPGPLNLLTDVAGLRVGNADDAKLKSGVTAVICDEPAVASFHVMGGAPGTRETDLLEPHNSVERINALVLSGGSAFGLDAASGVQSALRAAGMGFSVRGINIPIVPTAILFDMTNGGDKNWGTYPPYRELGHAAACAATTEFSIGTHGAGKGALTAGLKGGLGSASAVLRNGITVSALAAVNAVGSTTMGESAYFWAAPFEIGDEFGGLGFPAIPPPRSADVLLKFRDQDASGANTTLGIIATDAVLTKADAKRLAIAAHDGFARAIWPSHTPADGDLVFSLATGTSGITLGFEDAIDLYAEASSVMARAIARGVHAAVAESGDIMPVWAERLEASST
ncbi:MAG: P1 family peptidase [Rhizobiaceae bacterium]|nr:P1 family peptidase [Rhizobiaceae bacterium]